MKKFDISKFDPCKGGANFYEKFSTFEDAWQNCERGDWMLWIAKKMSVDIRTLTLAKGKCAETVLHLMKDERSKKAVETAISFGEGKATLKELNAAYAAAAAIDAADAADAAAADAAYAENQKKTAEICREYLTKEVFELIKKTK